MNIDTVDRLDIEREEEWRDAMKQIPFIDLPDGYAVKPIPPFGGAIARMIVRHPSGHEVSVYADFHARLGCVDHPYWEVYPYSGDVGRCDISDVDELRRMIIDSEPD